MTLPLCSPPRVLFQEKRRPYDHFRPCIQGVSQRHGGSGRRGPDHSGRRVCGHHRPFRRGQVHAAALREPDAPDHLRHADGERHRCQHPVGQEPAPVPPGHRYGVPVLQSGDPHHRHQERAVRLRAGYALLAGAAGRLPKGGQDQGAGIAG